MRIRHVCTTLLACSMPLLLSAPAQAQVHPHHAAQIRKAAKEVKPQVAPKKPRTVLIWNTPPSLMDKDPHKGYCIPYGEEGMKAIGEASGAFKPVVSDDIAMFAPENIKQFDAIVLNNASGPWITPTTADMAKPALKKLGADAKEVEKVLRKSFLDFLDQGGGVVCLHFAIAANQQWPEFKELFGGTFIGHPWTEEVGVTVEEPGHPLVAAFGGKDFRIFDEIYQYGPPYDRSKLRVLMSIDPSTTNMGPRWLSRKKDEDYALTWVKPYGKGRIFNTSFGHMASLYSTPQVLQFYLDAIQFATGDLEAPTAPREGRPVRKPVPGSQPVPGLEGFVSLFDGKTLDGWEGDRTIWSVRDGAIAGQTTADTKLKENNFLIWKDQVENFELRVKFRMEGGNSGIYYHARKRQPGQTQGDSLVGTQADFDASGRWTGVIMEYLLRDVLAERGQKVLIDEKGKKQVVGSLGDPKKLLEAVKIREWNDYVVVANKDRVVLTINGVTMCELEDRDPKRLVHGWLALQVHAGPPMLVQFKDIFLRRL
ncbi:MAG: family 16 glycoside hydrolase [Thermoguttaceae bacterium]